MEYGYGHQDNRSRPRVVADALERVFADFRTLAGWPSRWRLFRIRLDKHRHGEDEQPTSETVPLRIKSLDGQELHMRPRTADVDILQYAFNSDHHLPPAEVLDRPLRRVAELGTHIGASLWDLARRYPDAELLGVEPDPGNAELARRNLAPLGDRCHLVEAAVWDKDAELTVERGRREWGLVVRERRDDDPEDWPRIGARSVGSLLDELGPGERIDFIYMDIEGTERRVLGGEAPWAARVQSIRVECEFEYAGDPEATEKDLQRLGFETSMERHEWGAWVFGVRRTNLP